MARNYKISNYKIVEKKNLDSQFWEQNSGSVTITPDPGYTVKASKFSHGTLPPSMQSLTFADTTTFVNNPSAENKVIATFTFKSDFSITDNVKIVLPIKGYAWKLSKEQKVEFDIIYKDSYNFNGDAGMFAVNPLFTLGASAPHPTKPGYKLRKVSGYVHKRQSGVGKTTKTIWINISPNVGYIWKKAPIIKLNKQSKDILFERRSFTRGVRLNSEGEIWIYSTVIHADTDVDVDFNTGMVIEIIIDEIAKKDEERVINSIGISGSTGKTDTKRTISINATKDTEFDVVMFRKSTGKSILQTPNSTIMDSTFGIIPSKKFRLDKSKTVTINQLIPSSNILLTKTNGGFSSVSTITLDSVSGLLEGDKLTTLDKTQVPSSTIRTISSINIPAKQVTLNGNVSIADDKKVLFSRSDEYYIDVIPSDHPEGKPTFSKNIPEKSITADGREYFYSIKQNLDTVISLAWANTIGSGSHTLPDPIVFIGKNNTTTKDVKILSSSTIVNTSSRVGGSFRFTVLFKVGHPHGYGAPSSPSFSNTDAAASDWTNSIASLNGGSEVILHKFQATRSTTTTTNDTITLTCYGSIKKFGNQNVEMVFDLNEITAVYVP